MKKRDPFKCFKTSEEIIRLAVMLYVRFPLSLRNVEDLPHERGVDISHESVGFWWHRFGPMFAAEIRKRRIGGMKSSRWRWHLDEVFVKINGERHYLWRAVDHEGEVLEGFVTKTRDRKAALKFLKKTMKKDGRADVFVTDRLRSLCCFEGSRRGRPLGNGPLGEQPSGKLTSSVPTTGTSHAPLPAHANVAEVRRNPRLSL